VDGKSNREAGFPGDSFRFEVVPDSSGTDNEVNWSGGGAPATGTGLKFETKFATGGTFTVTAQRGESTHQFPVTVCPVDQWLAGAQAFYGPAIDLTKVRVKGSRLVFGPPGTGWTCNQVIRFKRPRRAEDLPVEATLIHELGHVWEHQTGQAQLLKGLVEQTGRLLGHDPYNFGGPDGVKRATELTGFSKESQAQILMEYWMSQQGYESDSNGVLFSSAGYTDDLRRLTEGAGIGTDSVRRRGVASSIDSFFGRLVNAVLALIE
jgi:hypothetical protein